MESGAKSNPLLIRGSCQSSRQQVWSARAARRDGIFSGRALNRLRRQIRRPANQLGQAPLQCSKREQPYAGFRVQLNDKIHVAIGQGLVTGNGAKQ
jgi:hypothetical protein